MSDDLNRLIFQNKIGWALFLVLSALIVLFAAPQIEYVAVTMLVFSGISPVCFSQDARKMRALLALPVGGREIANILLLPSIFMMPTAAFPILLLGFRFYALQVGAGSTLISIMLIPLAGCATAAYFSLCILTAWETNRRSRLLCRIVGPVGIVASSLIYGLTRSVNMGLISLLLFGMPIAFWVWKNAPLLLISDASRENGLPKPISRSNHSIGIKSPLLKSFLSGICYALLAFSFIFLKALSFHGFKIFKISYAMTVENDIVGWIEYSCFFGYYLFMGSKIVTWAKYLRPFRQMPLSSFQIALYMSGMIAGFLLGYTFPFSVVAWTLSDMHLCWMIAKFLLGAFAAYMLFSCTWLQWRSAPISLWDLLQAIVIACAVFSGAAILFVYKIYPPLPPLMWDLSFIVSASFLWLWRILSHSSAPYRSS